MAILLVIYQVYGESYGSSSLYWFITFSMWFLVTSWLFAPFVFNPSGFDWKKTVDDWTDWRRWMGNRGGIGVSPDKSWESWWDGEHEHLKFTNIRGRVLEIILACRFFIYQYGMVYHLDISQGSKSFLVLFSLGNKHLLSCFMIFSNHTSTDCNFVICFLQIYGLSWVVMGIVLGVLKVCLLNR